MKICKEYKNKINNGDSLYKILIFVMKNGNDVTGIEANATRISDKLKMMSSLSVLLFCFFSNNLYSSNPFATTVTTAMI